MCGIVGQINTEDKKPVDKHVFNRMRDTLKHRGPNNAGTYVYKNVGLGFRRLSIIDLTEAGNQPMSNEDNSVYLVFNGEFYNFKEYREKLISKGHTFKSRTDSEAIIHLYEEYGIDCVKHINGMFSLAIYDKVKNLLFLARDRFGVKPLFYYMDDNQFIFASELKAILAGNNIKKELDQDSVVDYFSVGYILPPHSIFKNIYKLEESSYLCFDLNKKKIVDKKKYWELKISEGRSKSINDWQERFENEFARAIKVRTISDVPIGVFLSGGLDSSAIVAFASKLMDERLKTFSIGFSEKAYDETKYSQLVAKKFKTEHTHEYVEPDMIDRLPKLAWHIDEPIDDSSVIPTYYLSQITKKGVTVALSGDGGDELLAGYKRYTDYIKYHKPFNFLGNSLRKSLFKLASVFARNYKYKRRMYFLGLPLFESFQEHMANFNSMEISSLISRDLGENYRSRANFESFVDTSISNITNLQNIDRHTYLPGDNLVKIDRASMANSLEVRSPFLDYKLWELVFSMPVNTRAIGSNRKIILKNSLKGMFDDKFLNREKMGFTLPLDQWFRGELNDYVRDILGSRKFINRNYFNNKNVENLIEDHSSGKKDNSRKLWSLLFFEHWCQKWLDS